MQKIISAIYLFVLMSYAFGAYWFSESLGNWFYAAMGYVSVLILFVCYMLKKYPRTNITFNRVVAVLVVVELMFRLLQSGLVDPVATFLPAVIFCVYWKVMRLTLR